MLGIAYRKWGSLLMRRRIFLASTSLAAMSCAITASAQSSTEAYTYDAHGRLITVVTTGGQNNGETQSICYDLAGNRTEYVANSSSGSSLCSPSAAQAQTQARMSLTSTTELAAQTSAIGSQSIVLTGPDLAVLPEHSSTYRCALINRSDLGIYSGGCWLIGSDVAVYQSEDGSAELDTGYSLQSPGVLQVETDRYGTGEAP